LSVRPQLLWSVIALALAAGGALALHRRRTGDGLPETLLAALLPALAAFAAYLVVDRILTSTLVGWNDIRLAPAAAWARGYDLYYLPGDGPLLGHIYGPVAAWIDAPVTLLPTPSAAIRAGVALSFLLYTLPAVLLFWTSGRRHPVLAAASVLFFVLYSLRSDVMFNAVAGIRADTPVVAFAALACAPLMDTRRRLRTSWLAASALAAVLSAGSKQVALPIVFALPFYVWLADGLQALFRYLGLVALWALCAGTVVLATEDVQAMVYQTVVVPWGHPWRFGNGLRAFVQTLRDLVPRAAFFGAVGGAYAFLQGRRAGGRLSIRTWVDANPWLVPFVVAVFFLPTSILGRMKSDGSLDTMVYTVYFLVLTALLVLLHFAGDARNRPGAPGGRLPALVLLVSLTALVIEAVPRFGPASAGGELPHDPEASAYAFVRDHPGEVYLPQNPLVSLMAEDRAYHLVLPTISQQYFERLAGGADLEASDSDDEAFRAHLPPELRYVLFRVEPGTLAPSVVRAGMFDHLRRYLPGFVRAEPVAPGWAALVSDPVVQEERR
jgi:hypothetical protein